MPNINHGLSKTKEYRAWHAMKQRCYNKNNPTYKYHGERGIAVCDRWRNSFSNFLEDMGKKPSDKHSLDRIDNNKGYSKRNCRWATDYEQNNNLRCNVILNYNGKSKTLSEWSKEVGINRRTLMGRLNLGWTEEEALTIEVKKKLPLPGEGE